MGYMLKYTQKTKAGIRYRRNVPEELREAFGVSRYFFMPLGSGGKEIRANYELAEEEYERRLHQAKIKAGLIDDAPQILLSELERYKLHVSRLRELGIEPDSMAEGEEEALRRSMQAEAILAKYPKDEQGDEYGLSSSDEDMVLELGGYPRKKPEIALSDAVTLYIKIKKLEDPKEKSSLDRVKRVERYIGDALGRDPKLSKLSREDARHVMDTLLEQGKSPATVERYLNDVRAIINKAITELELDCNNPFMRLNPEKDGPDKEKRRPFTDTEIVEVSERLLSKAMPEVRLIWRLLRGTGCRGSEIIGLRREDVYIDCEVPYIFVKWHEIRRLKTKVSIRRIPLVGDALEAAREALELSEGHHMLCPRYGPRGKAGADSVSTEMNKYVRAVIPEDRTVVAYSLRHNMKDWLRLVEAPQYIQEQISGRTAGGTGEDYGGYEAMLKVHHKWMLKVSELWLF